MRGREEGSCMCYRLSRLQFCQFLLTILNRTDLSLDCLSFTILVLVNIRTTSSTDSAGDCSSARLPNDRSWTRVTSHAPCSWGTTELYRSWSGPVWSSSAVCHRNIFREVSVFCGTNQCDGSIVRSFFLQFGRHGQTIVPVCVLPLKRRIKFWCNNKPELLLFEYLQLACV